MGGNVYYVLKVKIPEKATLIMDFRLMSTRLSLALSFDKNYFNWVLNAK